MPENFANVTAGVNPRPTKIGVQKQKVPQFCFGTNDDFERNSKLSFTAV
jgi:hypothetical protein